MLEGVLVLSVPVITLVVLGVLFLVNNPKDKNNIQFSIISFALALWVASNYLADSDIDGSLLWTRLAFLSVVIASGTFLLFAVSYPRNNLKSPVSTKFIWLLTSFVAISCMTDWVVLDVRYEEGISNVVTGKFYILFVAFFFSAMVLAVSLLIRSRQRATGISRRRIGIILMGVVIMTLIGSVTNLIAPLLTGANPLATAGSFSTVFFVGATYYAITRHKFLDVRSFVSRALAYLFLLGGLSAVYAVIFYTFSALFIDISNISMSQRLAFAVIAVIIATTIQPLKLAFDKLTSRIFFRDTYVTQEVLNSISSILAVEIDLKIIVESSSDVINSALRPSFIRFAVFKDGETYMDYWHGKGNRRKIQRKDLKDFTDIVATVDDVKGIARHILKKFDSQVILKLHTNEETVGAILLGQKQSGTIYTKQDIDLLTIIEKELAIAVQNSRYFEQIQEFNVTLQQEIKEATSKLRLSNEKLKALDEAKDEFISMASHQLRTPLTSVKGYISMVMEGDGGQLRPEQKKLLAEAFASSQRMVYLIADLLNVSRLRTGKFIIEPSHVYLPDLVEEEIEQLKPTARSRKLKVIFDAPKRFPKVWLDETKIRQVIMNLIDNAIYYTRSGGQIEVRLTSKKDSIEYLVKDNGIGVPKAEQAKLFTKFFRAGNARSARPDGTGLGLYMAQRVVSAHGGSIIFNSEEGKGSTFGFAFPLNKITTKPKVSAKTKVPAIPAEEPEL